MQELKKIVRNEALAKRRVLTADKRHTNSVAIVTLLANSDLFLTASTIATYIPLASEVDVSILQLRHKHSKAFAAPRTQSNFEMRYHQLNDTTRLEVGAGQVQQPTEAAPEIALDAINLFLVPLAACDIRGNRLGFGRGYYDRALANAKGFKLGVGFRCQLLEDVPFEPHDIPLDGFISEEGLIRF